jgi:uncharacterized membrane protein (DUF485 family)
VAGGGFQNTGTVGHAGDQNDTERIRRDDKKGADMQEVLVQQIVANPHYQQLVRVRTRFGWTLTALMMIVYYGFIVLIAFDKELLAARIGNGVMTWGIPAGLFVIVFTVVVTGIYVTRANKQFDELTETIRREVL